MTSIDNVATKIFSIFGLILLTHATTMSFIAKHITQKSQGLAWAFSLHNIKLMTKLYPENAIDIEHKLSSSATGYLFTQERNQYFYKEYNIVLFLVN